MSVVDPVEPEDNTPEAVAPVRPAERIGSLDILRGVAIFGILAINIYGFAMPFIAYSNPLTMGGTEPYNLGTWFVTHIFVDQKFLTIFAMLFGAGIVLMTTKAKAKGVKPGRIYLRRQLWLVMIGAVHAYLIWFGDILVTYALVGLLAYLFRNLAPRTLVIIACFMLSVGITLSHGYSYYVEDTKQEVEETLALQEAGEALTAEQSELLEGWESSRLFMAPNDEDLQKDRDRHLGGYLEIVEYRAPLVMTLQIANALFFGLWRVTALMFVGMALMKWGVFSLDRPARFYRNLALVGYGAGLPLTIFSAYDLFQHEFDFLYVLRYGSIANYWGSIIVSLGHIGLVLLVVKQGALGRLTRRLAAVGRMALTNYLLHSVILTTIFYGYGMGLYGSVPRLGQMAFVAGMIGLQLAISPWWLARFRFGPVEWVWRSLTYWRKQPMQITHESDRLTSV
jgi:uncharacterized protein